MVNCLNGAYVQPDPLQYGWKLDDEVLVPLWYEGDALPADGLAVAPQEDPQSTSNENEMLEGLLDMPAESNDTEFSDDSANEEDIPLSEQSSDEDET